jgi:hypothetical protein
VTLKGQSPPRRGSFWWQEGTRNQYFCKRGIQENRKKVTLLFLFIPLFYFWFPVPAHKRQEPVCLQGLSFAHAAESTSKELPAPIDVQSYKKRKMLNE